MTNIEKLLVEHGPLISGDLARLLEEEQGLSKTASRKHLSRYSHPVRRLSGFFLNNQGFFYLAEHTLDGSFGRNFLDVIKTSAKRMYVVLKALEYNKGYLHRDEIASYSFSPTANLIGHKRFDLVLQQLVRLQIIRIDGDYYRLNEIYFSSELIDFRYYKAIHTARNFLLNQFADWAKSIGLVSFDSVDYSREFSKFQWAFSAPSYVGTLPVLSPDGTKPAFVLADVVIGNEVQHDHIQFFIEKLKVLKSLKGHSRILPFLIVDVIPKESLIQLKQMGVIVGFVFKLFGDDYSALVKRLIQTIANAGAILKKNPDDFLELMKKISVLTVGKTNNLRGDVFELAVCYYHARGSKHFDPGKKIYFEAQPYELDVFAVYEDRVVIAECKGTQSPVTLAEVERWQVKTADLRKWIDMQEAYNGKRHHFEFWSTGGYSEDALEKIQALSKAKRFTFEFLGRNEIIAKAKETKTTKFIDILNQYFLKEPV